MILLIVYLKIIIIKIAQLTKRLFTVHTAPKTSNFWRKTRHDSNDTRLANLTVSNWEHDSGRSSRQAWVRGAWVADTTGADGYSMTFYYATVLLPVPISSLLLYKHENELKVCKKILIFLKWLKDQKKMIEQLKHLKMYLKQIFVIFF